MTFANLMVLMPTMAIHLLITILLACIVWAGLVKLAGVKVSIWAPVLVGVFFSLFNASSVIIGIYQNKNWAEAQRLASIEPALTGDANELKQKFLAEVEKLIAQPNAINQQVQTSLFQRYANIFKGGAQDLQSYFNALSQAYECERVFFEDAIASLEKKSAVKGQKQVACEALPGTFFGREKLVTEQNLARNKAVLDAILSGKPLKDAQGNEIKITKEVLSGNMNTQAVRLQGLQRIFSF